MTENDLPADAIVDPRTFIAEDLLHGMLARVRRTDPLPYLEPEGFRPFWLVSRHADINMIERAADRYLNAPATVIFSLEHERRALAASGGVDTRRLARNLVQMDGEEHRSYRGLTQPDFLPKAINAIKPDIEALAAEFLDRMAAKGRTCDFASDIAIWYPLRVIMRILGVPPEDEELMLRLTQKVLSSQDPEFVAEGGTSASAIMEMFSYFKPIIEDRRKTPRDDIASVIANARYEGELLSIQDIFGYYLIIATAGHDTTSYSLSGGLLALLQHPDEFAKLRADRSLIPTAVEEILRWTSPVRHFCRTAAEDSVISGKSIHKGDVLLLSFPSANRDETEFPDPFAFKVDRRPNRQLAFGTGPHVCLGQYLARLELTSFLREFLDRVEDVELAAPPRFTESAFVGGVKSLPIRYRVSAVPARSAA